MAEAARAVGVAYAVASQFRPGLRVPPVTALLRCLRRIAIRYPDNRSEGTRDKPSATGASTAAEAWHQKDEKDEEDQEASSKDSNDCLEEEASFEEHSSEEEEEEDEDYDDEDVTYSDSDNDVGEESEMDEDQYVSYGDNGNDFCEKDKEEEDKAGLITVGPVFFSLSILSQITASSMIL
ncbi:hypothetical protein BZA05DRAFT_422853 [Tricharina praecox]|uniref:uncharacterized protein n=1 Tax=Tricharina praecox TaxID=43433 RepID=UPI002220615C|nr:uncharacterized protein BZA05DRAFT_422853 [Tricharina praecox]KAI5841317.1 hypothetical protein BZA05DRAFT_422853 [Tricharina praecox]